MYLSENITSLLKDTTTKILNKEISLDKKDKMTMLSALDELSYPNKEYEEYLKRIIIQKFVNSAWKDFEPFYNSLVTVEMKIDWEKAWYIFVRNYFI